MITNPVNKLVGLALLAAFAFFTPAEASEGATVNPWVITDCSVNCFDYQSMVADLTRGLTDPQDQAIAIFNFFRRSMFPYAARVEYPFPVNDQQHMFDFVRMVNVYGYTLCTQNNWMFASVCKQSGLFEDARGVSVPGHGTAEVKWNGRWHFMDAIVGCYAFRRDRREIASIDDIVADTTLLTRAVAEGRAGMPFCPWDGEPVYPEGALAQTDQWFTYRKYGVDFLLGALPEYEPSNANEPNTHTMAFNLRPGFRLTRLWDNLPGMYNQNYDFSRKNKKNQSPSPAILPPHHPDGGREKRDVNNWPIIEPYSKVIKGRESYHYYANGLLSYEDMFSDKRVFRAADSVKSLEIAEGQNVTGNVLRCKPGTSDGEVFFTFEAPYVFVGGKVEGRAKVTDGSWVAVYMDIGESENWLCLGVVESGGDFCFEIPANLLEQRYRFGLKLKLHDRSASGSVSLLEFKAEAVCQLNMYSLPFLKPGRNMVTVLADRIPDDARLVVTYKWQEQGWDRVDRRVVNSGGESYTIEVAGSQYPRMKEIIMECLPE